MCELYASTPCDIADYFDCLEDAYGSCSGGTFPDLDSAAIEDCTTLATCD